MRIFLGFVDVCVIEKSLVIAGDTDKAADKSNELNIGFPLLLLKILFC